ncbi:MAG: endonuclease domain-containing protein [Nitrospirae bacterium]|nr:endonuclease domain-containing protein [Nitrospirota bacterium]
MDHLRARELRKNLTEVERKLWRHLRLRQLEGYKFRRQQPIGRFIVDFVCFEKKLIVELDGGQHSEQIVYDSQRTAWLESQGYRVLRFWNHQVFEEIKLVEEAIYEALRTS